MNEDQERCVKYVFQIICGLIGLFVGVEFFQQETENVEVKVTHRRVDTDIDIFFRKKTYRKVEFECDDYHYKENVSRETWDKLRDDGRWFYDEKWYVTKSTGGITGIQWSINLSHPVEQKPKTETVEEKPEQAPINLTDSVESWAMEVETDHFDWECYELQKAFMETERKIKERDHAYTIVSALRHRIGQMSGSREKWKEAFGNRLTRELEIRYRTGNLDTSHEWKAVCDQVVEGLTRARVRRELKLDRTELAELPID